MGKSFKKSNRAALVKNERLNKTVLGEEDTVFGRALKTLGNGRFRIQVPDLEGHGVEADAFVGGKTVVRIRVGDVVIVGRNETSKNVTYEIVGACEPRVVEQLRKDKRLHPSLFSEDDELGEDLFDRSEVAGDEEGAVAKKEKANKPVKKDKLLEAKAADDDDVNIDSI